MAADAISRRYDLLRKRNEQDINARAQQDNEGIKRNFARTGGLGGGAQMKIQQQATAQREQDAANAREGLDVAESGERFQQDQINEQRAYQTSEREAAQKFARGERMGSQRFSTKERLGAQKFAALESKRQRGFSNKLFDREMKFKNKQFEESVRQFAKQFKLDEEVAKFNMDMAEKVFNKKGLLEGFFGQFGTNQMLGGIGDVGTGVFGGIASPGDW